MSLVERCFWCDELDPYGTHRCDKEWTMTDFTREDMRERLRSLVWSYTGLPRQVADEVADAIMDKLYLWEVYEAAEAFLAAWTASDGSEVRAAIELGRELRNLRGE